MLGGVMTRDAPILLVSGTLGLDRIHSRRVEDSGWILGGSAAYAAMGAAAGRGRGMGAGAPSIRLLAVVGSDLPDERLAPLRAQGIELDGVERRPGKTFRWEARYDEALHDRRTLLSEPGVMAGPAARLPSGWQEPPPTVLLLGCDDPERQGAILDAFAVAPPFILADTMRLWIRERREALLRLLPRVELLLLNDAEAEALLAACGGGGGEVAKGEGAAETLARGILGLGARRVVVKLGAAGACYADGGQTRRIPPVPLGAGELLDPTGAGDTFAGALAAAVARSLGQWQGGPPGAERLTEAIVAALPLATAEASAACKRLGVSRSGEEGAAHVED